MRIAGINSPNYHLNQTNKPPKAPTHGGDLTAVPEGTASKAVSNGTENQPLPQKGSIKKVSQQQNDELAQLYNQIQQSQAGAWQTVASNGQATANPTSPTTPDNTNHKARVAISEYLQTQYIEERQQFTAAVGIDDYA